MVQHVNYNMIFVWYEWHLLFDMVQHVNYYMIFVWYEWHSLFDMVQHVELLLAETAGPPQVDQKQQQVVGDDDVLEELQGVGVHLEVPDEEEKHLG